MRYYTRKIKKFSRGDIVFSEDSECDGMYIIDKGRVRVYKTIQKDEQAHVMELCQLGPKAMFGEMALLDDSKRSASVQALEATECTIITPAIFEDQLTRIPPWMVNMIRILVQRLRDTNDKLREHISHQIQSAPPPEDTGSMIVVDTEKEPEESSGNPKDTLHAYKKSGEQHISPDDIINDLFDKTKDSTNGSTASNTTAQPLGSRRQKSL